eukprot:EG_transcript_1129
MPTLPEPCFICFEESPDTVAGPCQHGMCRACAVAWLRQKQECAYCRQPLRMEELADPAGGPVVLLLLSPPDEAPASRTPEPSQPDPSLRGGSPTTSSVGSPSVSPTLTVAGSPTGPASRRQGSLPDIRWVTPMPPQEARRASDAALPPRSAAPAGPAQLRRSGLSHLRTVSFHESSWPQSLPTNTSPVSPGRVPLSAQVTAPPTAAPPADDAAASLRRSASLPSFTNAPPAIPTPPVIRRGSNNTTPLRIDAPMVPPATRPMARVIPPVALRSRRPAQAGPTPTPPTVTPTTRSTSPALWLIPTLDALEGTPRPSPPAAAPSSAREAAEPIALDTSMVRSRTPTGMLSQPRAATPPNKTSQPRALAPSRQAPFQGGTASWPQSVRSASPPTPTLPQRSAASPVSRPAGRKKARQVIPLQAIPTI